MNRIAIRPFETAEWQRFREFRLAALAAEPGVFASSYSDAEARPAEDWKRTIEGSDRRVFGLFDDQRLIGITAAFTWREDPTGRTAFLAMSFILPEYRGRRLSRVLYRARLDWIRAQKQFARVVVSHRASNEASGRAMLHFGFRETHRARKIWPDSGEEDEVFYELNL